MEYSAYHQFAKPTRISGKFTSKRRPMLAPAEAYVMVMRDGALVTLEEVMKETIKE